MAKRQFVQLCQTYVPGKYRLNGWLVSPKLDGMRAFWDGGLTRGMRTADVPWANVEKDKKDTVATGLWSRLGKVIYAPDEWLDKLPRIPLDGELYIGPKLFQRVMSICKAQHGMTDWSNVKYHIFDSPPYEVIFADGEVEVRIGDQKYSRYFTGIMDWIEANKPKKGKILSVVKGSDFESVFRTLQKMSIENDVVQLIPQTRLPVSTPLIEQAVEKALEDMVGAGIEGVIMRAHYESWRPIRADYILKYKPHIDDEGKVIGYIYGKGKHTGRMGAMIVEWQDKTFELSGFTNLQRTLISTTANGYDPVTVAQSEASAAPGKRAGEHISNPMFPVGSVVTFRYNELSDDGIPTEGRYLRRL